jgi:uncharacterized protein (DUF488 family)
MRIFTIGFTKKSAEAFFQKLQDSGTKRVVDVRLNNTSQLSGFAKKDDLKFLLREIAHLDYIHLPELAPTHDLLNRYRKVTHDWSLYEIDFLELMRARAIEKTVPREILSEACLLCSENSPHHCHRRLVAEYLKERWGDVEIVHLV